MTEDAVYVPCGPRHPITNSVGFMRVKVSELNDAQRLYFERTRNLDHRIPEQRERIQAALKELVP
jgi:hypothetical protein